MNKFLVVFPVLFLSLIILPHTVFGATVPAPPNGIIKTASGIVVKNTDQTPLTAAQAKALSAAMNKVHNEKAVDRKIRAQRAVMTAKHKAALKKSAKKKVVVKKKSKKSNVKISLMGVFYFKLNFYKRKTAREVLLAVKRIFANHSRNDLI